MNLQISFIEKILDIYLDIIQELYTEKEEEI